VSEPEADLIEAIRNGLPPGVPFDEREEEAAASTSPRPTAVDPSRSSGGGADSASRFETGGRGGRRWEATTAAHGPPTVYERLSSLISCKWVPCSRGSEGQPGR
jgi:hypothetical protein